MTIESTKHDAIYLQLCDDEDSEWHDTVTWCQDRVHDSDVKYIRADLVESLQQQLGASQKREVMLRGRIKDALWDETWWRVDAAKALDATNDIDDVILCYAESVGSVMPLHELCDEWLVKLPVGIKLYRAWEPK